MGPPPPSASGGSVDKVYGAGLAIGTLQGVTPFGTMIDGIQTSAGVGVQGPPRYQFGKATGQAIGGLALMVLGSGGTTIVKAFCCWHGAQWLRPPAPFWPPNFFSRHAF